MTTSSNKNLDQARNSELKSWIEHCNILTNKRKITSDATAVTAPTTSGGFGQRNIPGIAADVRLPSVFNHHPSYRFTLVIKKYQASIDYLRYKDIINKFIHMY